MRELGGEKEVVDKGEREKEKGDAGMKSGESEGALEQDIIDPNSTDRRRSQSNDCSQSLIPGLLPHVIS
uniref:Uncharacterized protein n=1 Tax=Wuchereria bancrofti TaxID=6293 RepID=A0AAF5PN37_WUCBA